MGPFVLVHVALSGFFLCAALYATRAWWLSRDDRTLLLFALQAALCVPLSLAFVGVASAGNMAEAEPALGVRLIAGLLALAVTAALVARMTGVRASVYVRTVATLAIAVSILRLAVPPSLDAALAVRHATLPWGEQVAVPMWPSPPWWFVPLYGLVISVDLFGVYGAARLASRDRLGGALIGLATAGGLATSVAAYASDTGALATPYFGDLPFAFWVLFIGVQLSRENARMHRSQAMNQQRLRAIFEHTLHYMGLLDVNGVVLDANRPMLAMMKLSAGAVLGQPFWQTPLWAHSSELRERVRLATTTAAAGETVRFETWHPMPDGTIGHVDFSIKPITDDSGQVVLLLPEGLDITARKKTQEALDRLVDVVAPRTGQDFFQTMVDTLCEICQVDLALVGSTDVQAPAVLRSIAVSHHGHAADPFPYDLKGTPCQTVIGQDLCYYRTDVRALFPDDAMLADFGMDAYMGIPIVSTDGFSRGIVALLRDRPFEQPEQAKALLHVVAARAGAELERRRTDAALQESESRFRTLIEDLDVGVVMQDAHERIVVTNPAAARMLGLAEERLRGLASHGAGWALLAEDGTAYPSDQIPAVVAARTRQPVRNIIVGSSYHDHSTRTWMQMTATPHLGADGALLHVLVTMVDVTDRKRAEDALRASSRRLALAISATSDAVWEWNYRTGETYYSPRWFEMLGLSPDLPMTVDTFIARCHPDDLEATLAKIDGAVQANSAWEVEFRMQRGDGTWSWVLSRGNAVEWDGQGQATMLAGTHTDVTSRKEAEARRRELELRLAQSHRMESMGRLAGGIAHDFNNILTVINGYSDLLLHSARLESSATEMLTDIRSAGDRAAALTRQLLTFSRSQVVDPDILDLNVTVADTQRMLQRLIGEHIDLLTEFDTEPLWVRADTGQLAQVIVNLAVNARDAMPQGGTLKVSTARLVLDVQSAAAISPNALPGSYAVLKVHDTGTGIPEELQELVFEPFFTTKGPGKGTGLGLTTVHSIVSQSGGHLEVQSRSGAGSTFTIYLPLVAAPAMAREHVAPGTSPVADRKTVLMVEDEQAVRNVGQMMLRRMGFDVLAAANATEAIGLAESLDRPIDLLVTDVIMPGVNGRQLAERLIERRPGLRVLYMSGYTDDPIVQQVVLNNEATYLQKPFDAEALARKVRQALDSGAPGERGSLG
jgi:PAS domain S-box-containing protein